MKKLLTVVFVLAMAFSFSNANAQIGFGLLAGINLANVTGDDVDMGDLEPDNLFGIAGGGFLNAPLGESFNFRAELLYSQHGAKWEESGDSYSMKMAYLAVPLMFQYCIPVQGSIMPFITAGGYLAFNLSAKEVWDIGGDEDEEDIKDDISSMDYGIMFGAGVIINNMIEIAARYGMGLADVVDIDDPPDVKNKVIQILAGIHL